MNGGSTAAFGTFESLMREVMKSVILTFVLVMCAIASASDVPSETSSHPIHRFYTKAGQTVGYLYGQFTEKGLLKSAEIKLNGRTLYSISKKGFTDEMGNTRTCGCTDYGFTINKLTSMEFAITIADKDGREVSDTLEIEWNEKAKKFQPIYRP